MGKLHLLVLIRKYLRGQATESEKKQLESWWQYFQQDDSYLKSLTNDEREGLRNEMLANIWQRIEAETSEPVAPVHHGKVIQWSVVRWVAAAIVVLISGLLLFWYQTGEQVIRTAYGQKQQITLPDGSIVTLNGNSSLRYNADWDELGKRDVWLEGEAFFAVQHTRNNQKFTVHTPDQLAVEVLGTRFNVQNRRGMTEVVLQEGKVKVVDPHQQTYLLRPGQQIRYTKAVNRVQPAKANLSHELAWQTQTLIFSDQPLTTVLAELHDSYGLQVELRNPTIGQELFSGSVPTDDVQQILAKIEKIYGVSVTRQGETFIVE